MEEKLKCIKSENVPFFGKKTLIFLLFQISNGISSGYHESIPKMLWPWGNEDWFSPSQQEMAKISLFGCENSSLISTETSEDV